MKKAEIAQAGRHLTLPLTKQRSGHAQMALRPLQIRLHRNPAPAYFVAEILYAASGV